MGPVSTVPGPAGPAAIVPDSGWQNLNGFSYYDSNPAFASVRPQVRKIGQMLHFRGLVIIPLAEADSSSTLIPLADYSSFKSAVVFQGTSTAGGCLVNVDGSITFNQNSNTIPTSIIPNIVTTPIDSVYVKQNVIATRRIQTYVDITPSAASSGGAILNSVISVFVYTNGKIAVQTLKDIENQVDPLNTTEGVNSLRFITSKVIQGQRPVNQVSINTGNTLHSSSVVSTLPYDMRVENSQFFAFDCDASLAEDLGGFTFRLDGLTAFVAPL
jgi:hypothetical protein